MFVQAPHSPVIFFLVGFIPSCVLLANASGQCMGLVSGQLVADPSILLNDSSTSVTSQNAGVDDLGLDLFPQSFGNLTSSPISPFGIIDVVISNCKGLRFKPMPYNSPNLASGYYHLSQANSLSPLYSNDPNPACKNGPLPVGYGREHIYEVQLISMFIDQIMMDHQAIWQRYANVYPTDTKCKYIANQILKSPVQGGVPLITSLLRCLPYNMGQNNQYMPWLDNLANGIKASAFNGHTLRREQTFKADPPTKKVMVMRAVAGVVSYMNSPNISTSFIEQSQCMRGQWERWLLDYETTNPGSNPMGGTTMTAYYNTWITGKVQSFETNLQTGLSSMIGWWVEQYNQGNPTQANNIMVNYNYPCKYNSQAAGTVGVSNNDLTSGLLNYTAQNPLNWINNLSV
jgi:hypothetical protein